MLFFRIVAIFWPFLKEMILGDKTLPQAMRRHRGRLFILGMIFFSLFLNAFAVPRLLKISSDYVILNRKYQQLTHAPISTIPPATAPPLPTPQPIPTRPTAPAVVHHHSTRNWERYQQTKEDFERMQSQEAKQMKAPLTLR